MVSRIKKFFQSFKGKTEQEEMEEFLSQAYDNAHLEYLMARWEHRKRKGYTY
jgi:hypothetical protein